MQDKLRHNISLIIFLRKFYGILCATRKGHQNVLSYFGDHCTGKLMAEHHITTRSSDDGMIAKITEDGDDDDDDHNHDTDDENDHTCNNMRVMIISSIIKRETKVIKITRTIAIWKIQ